MNFLSPADEKELNEENDYVQFSIAKVNRIDLFRVKIQV